MPSHFTQSLWSFNIPVDTESGLTRQTNSEVIYATGEAGSRPPPTPTFCHHPEEELPYPSVQNKERVLVNTSPISASYRNIANLESHLMTCFVTTSSVVATTSTYSGNYLLKQIWISIKPSRSPKPWRLPNERLRTYSHRLLSRPSTLTSTLSEEDVPQREDPLGRKAK